MFDSEAFLPFESKPQLTLLPMALSVYRCETLPENCEPLLFKVLEALAQVWPSFLEQIATHQLLSLSGLHLTQTWDVELLWVNNPIIQQVNALYRDKNQATDVLTFTLFADSPHNIVLAQLPTVQLGSVLVSVDWVYDYVNKYLDSDNSTRSKTFIQYALERVIHGCLHLLGVTHETHTDYNRVVGIQAYVLDAINWTHLNESA